MKSVNLTKVVVEVIEVHKEPEIVAVYACPFCKQNIREEIFDDNYTERKDCPKCHKVFEIQVPKTK